MNKNINNYTHKKLCILISLILVLSSNLLVSRWGWDMYSFDKNLFVGNISFPQTIKAVPQIALYRRGLKVPTEVDNNSGKIQFTISEDKECKHFWLLITQYVQPKIADNTVKYLTIDANQHKKLYEIWLTAKHEDIGQPSEKTTYAWSIQEQEGIKTKDGNAIIIPDDALIILFNSEYVEALEGGNDLELPKIIIKKDVLALAGSKEKLQNEANEILLGSHLDLNILHPKPTSEVKPEYKKRVVITMFNPD